MHLAAREASAEGTAESSSESGVAESTESGADQSAEERLRQRGGTPRKSGRYRGGISSGAQFPDMDLVVPTTEPAPEIIRIGTRNWIVKDLQQARLMELDLWTNDDDEQRGEAHARGRYRWQNKAAMQMAL